MRHDSLLADQLKLTQDSNANDAYFAKLTDYARKPDDYIPIFSYVDGSKHPNRIRGNNGTTRCLRCQLTYTMKT